MYDLLLAVGVCLVGYWFYYVFLLGFKKGNIVMTFNERFIHHEDHIQAVKRRLKDDGRHFEYLGDRKFIVDGKPYLFMERTVPGDFGPLQQTILKGQRKAF